MRRRTKTRIFQSSLALAAILGGLRLYLPRLVLRIVNRKLTQLQGYQGRVDGIGISLWRGAYQIEGVTIEKNGGKVPVPFFSADTIDFSLEWGAFLHRRIVSDIEMLAPRLDFVHGPTEETSAEEPNESFAATLKSLAPFDIDRLEIKNGQVHYRDFSSSPNVDIALTRLQATARNLRNIEEGGVALPAEIRIRAKAFETGDLVLALKFDPLSEYPAFELKQTLSRVELIRLNDFFMAYAKVRAKTGEFGLYAEAAAKDGLFIGYVKPILTGLTIDKGGEQNIAGKAWADVVSAVKWIFSNKRKKQLATRIPLEGRFDHPKIGLWAAVGGILKNAYVKALTPTLDGVNLGDVQKVRPQ
jgi:uncharacterized protein DUF748